MVKGFIRLRLFALFTYSREYSSESISVTYISETKYFQKDRSIVDQPLQTIREHQPQQSGKLEQPTGGQPRRGGGSIDVAHDCDSFLSPVPNCDSLLGLRWSPGD